MSHNFYNREAIKPPAPALKYIPPGKFIAIDEKYYTLNKPEENKGTRGKSLKPHGNNSNYQPTEISKFGVKQRSGLTAENMKVNYKSYIYNQITGWDENHK